MSKSNNLGDFLTDIANTIRTKTGGSSAINAQDFSTAIANIPTGVSQSIFNGLLDRTITTLDLSDSGLTTLGVRALSGCTYLNTLILPSTLTSIGSYGCNSIGMGLDSQTTMNITLPSTLTSLGSNAFYYLGWNTSTSSGPNVIINYEGTLEQWFGITFSNRDANPVYSNNYGSNHKRIDLKIMISGVSTSLTDSDLVIPNTISSIGAYCFSQLRFNSITIPTSITSIGNEAFLNSSTNITYEGTKAQLSNITIGTSVFSIQPVTVHCTDGDATILQNGTVNL